MDKHSAKYVLLLVSSWVLGLSGLVFYTPAMTGLESASHATIELIQLTISFFLLGKALSMLSFGPFAEAIPRKQVLLFGLLLFIAGSATCGLANSIYVILLGRVIQGLGTGFCIMMGRAIVNDSYEHTKACNIFSYIFMANAIAIMLLPVIGGYVAHYFTWRGTFLVLTAYSVLVFFLIWIFLPASKRIASAERLSLQSIKSNYKKIMQSHSFWGFLLALAFMMAGEKAFTTSASFIYMKHLGMSKVQFGYLMGVFWAAHLIGVFVCGRLVFKFGVNKMIAVGIWLIVFAAGVLIASVIFRFNHGYLLALTMLFYMFGSGFVITTAAVGVIRPFPTLIGFATAFAMFLEFGIAFVVSAIVSFVSTQSATASSLIIGLMGLLAFLAWLFLIRLRPFQELYYCANDVKLS